MHYQPIFDIAALCFQKGIRQVVLCPGSRCAPLTLAFTRHPGVVTRTFSDERSAGFIGLGIAQQTGNPVVLVCTSGSAAYNFAPAVAEAYFSNTPLVVFTADRPREWIAQHDGQTIYQSGIYGRHVKASFDLPQDYHHPDSTWAINRIINEAVNLSMTAPAGPVHINAPFREPLYPPASEKTTFTEGLRVIAGPSASYGLSDEQRETIRKDLRSFSRILIVAGQGQPDPALWTAVREASRSLSAPVVADIISNADGHDIIRHSDLFLGQAPDDLKKSLQPDLLITFGGSLISKNLKLFLRRHPAARHWHIQEAGVPADTFKSLTDTFHCAPADFMTFVSSIAGNHNGTDRYAGIWHEQEARGVKGLSRFFEERELSELYTVRQALDKLPDSSELHLANSMSVRYANFVGLPSGKRSVAVHANRGTSGIDGSTSAAVGHSLVSDRLNLLITGDVAFFYDRNAFWHNYPLPNLRVLLLNNHGGLIFNIIDGPSTQPEAAEYFITRQALNARNLCAEFGFEHLRADSLATFEKHLPLLFNDDARVRILEVETDVMVNRKAFDKLKQKIKDSYEL